LFAVARLLHDDYLEEEASCLLQEVLVEKTKDVGFENGLAGIAYVLLRLKRDRFVEIDFGEVFGNEKVQIQSWLQSLNDESSLNEVTNALKSIYYLQQLHDNGDVVDDAILENISSQVYRHLKKKFPVGLFGLYAEVCCHNTLIKPQAEILSLYVDLYGNNKLTNDARLGFQLLKVGMALNDASVKAVAKSNIYIGLRNVYPQAMTLKEKIDVLCTLKGASCTSSVYTALEQDLQEGADETVIEKKLLNSIPSYSYKPSFQSGIARLLLYHANVNALP
jgi:hypothetical protein